MGESCTKVNVIIIGSVTTYLDKYVVLAFFLSLIVSVITVLLLVKCVTYYVQEDRKRLKRNLALPRMPAPVEDLEESDSEFNELWSDDDDDEGAVADTAGDEAESDDSEEGLENLDTNYVTLVRSESSLRKHNALAHHLLNELKEKSDNIPFVPNECLTHSLFPHVFTTHRIDLFNIFYDKLLEAVWLRKSCLLQILNFLLGLLCEMHVLPRDTCMKLQGKYEQEIEDYSGVETSIDLSFGTVLQNIVQNMPEDLLEMGADVEEGSVEGITYSLFVTHFDCLKCLTAEFGAIERLIESHELQKLGTIMDAQCYQLQLKNRIFSVIRFIDTGKVDKTVMATVTTDYKQKVTEVLLEFGSKFSKDLQTMIRVNSKYRKDELDKLLVKHERDFSVLKQEMTKTYESKGVEESITTFSDYIILLFKEYIKENNEMIIKLNQHEEMQLKTHYAQQYKTIIGKLNDIEADLFSSLLEVYKSNDRLVFITNAIESDLKSVKEKCTELKKHLNGKYINVTQNWTKFTQVIIDYIIKAVSSEFRCLKTTFTASLRQIPIFSEELVTNILNSIQRKFSIIVFDIVVVLIEDIIKTTRHAMYNESKHVQPKQYMCSIFDLAEELKDYNGADYVVSIDMLNWLIPEEVDLTDFALDEFLNNYKELIYQVLNDIVTKIIEEEIEPLQAKLTLEHYEKHLNIYENIQKIVSKESEKPVEDSGKKKKYLSRKGASHSEKSKVGELMDAYKSCLGMKEAKVLALRTNIEERRSSRVPSKDKSAGIISSCLELLKRQVESNDLDLNSEMFVSLFKCEEEYMINRFGKTVQKLAEEDRVDAKEPEKEKGGREGEGSAPATLKKRRKGSAPFKTRNAVSPEPVNT